MTHGKALAAIDAPGLKSALNRLQGAGSRTQVLEAVRVCLNDLGLPGAVLLCVRPETSRPRSRISATEASAVTPVDPDSEPGRIIREGVPVDLDVEDLRAGAPGLPDLAGSIRVLPCSGPGSTRALGVPRHGSAAPAGAALDTIVGMTGIALERLDALQREREGRYELQNRIRNVVATIRAVSARSAERAESLDDYVLHFEGRLDAMSRHHVAFAWTGADRLDLEDLVRSELLSEGIQEGPNVQMRGMTMTIQRGVAETLGLALHELAVNAVKFGPFSGRGGSLSVRWWMESGASGVLQKLEWREACELPAPAGPYRVGFGRHILEHALPYESSAATELLINPYGLLCSIAVPVGTGAR